MSSVCAGKGLVTNLQVYHGRLLFPLDYQPGKPPPPPPPPPSFIRSVHPDLQQLLQILKPCSNDQLYQ